jgi:tetrahydromethanopterin S-methyltransferase subunit G
MNTMTINVPKGEYVTNAEYNEYVFRTDHKFEDVTTIMLSEFDKVHNTFTGIDKKFAEIDEKFVIVKKRLDAIETRLDKIGSRLDTLEQKMDILTGQMILVLSNLTSINALLLQKNY